MRQMLRVLVSFSKKKVAFRLRDATQVVTLVAGNIRSRILRSRLVM
jgi:hypothetical protein